VRTGAATAAASGDVSRGVRAGGRDSAVGGAEARGRGAGRRTLQSRNGCGSRMVVGSDEAVGGAIRGRHCGK